MKLRLSLILAAIFSASAQLVARFRPQPQHGLNTEQDAEEFVAIMHADTDITPEAEPGDCPIFEALEAEWAALMARRTRIMRAPTMEMRIVFDEMVSDMDVDWRCLHCCADEHTDCPGCSCSCSLVEVS